MRPWYPADKLRQIVSAEDGDATLTLENDADTLLIQAEPTAQFKVMGPPSPATYPTIPDESAANGAKDSFEHCLASSLEHLITRHDLREGARQLPIRHQRRPTPPSGQEARVCRDRRQAPGSQWPA